MAVSRMTPQAALATRPATTAHSRTRSVEGSRPWWAHLAWVGVAGLLGLASSGIFANLIELPRPLFVLVHLVLAGSFVAAYAVWSDTDVLGAVRHKWTWGLAAAFVLSVFLVRSVVTQDSSPRPEGLALVGNLLWLGLVYGVLDALFLTVMPVGATWRALRALGWTAHWPGKLATGVACLVASLAVTALYHFGFAEYQNGDMVNPLIGNGAMSLGYILSGNPISAVVAHVAMHVASVLHGIETTAQLPPHF